MSKKDKTEALLHFYQDKRSLASIPSSKVIPTLKAQEEGRNKDKAISK
jgi:hypothetical protein